jgi:hypothetical protein
VFDEPRALPPCRKDCWLTRQTTEFPFALAGCGTELVNTLSVLKYGLRCNGAIADHCQAFGASSAQHFRKQEALNRLSSDHGCRCCPQARGTIARADCQVSVWRARKRHFSLLEAQSSALASLSLLHCWDHNGRLAGWRLHAQIRKAAAVAALRLRIAPVVGEACLAKH